MARGARQAMSTSNQNKPMRLGDSGKGSPARESAPDMDRVTAVLARAKESGLRSGKRGRIAGRVSPELIERAKARTGLQSDTELVEFALANIAIEDNFAEVFRKLEATVDPDLDLEF